MAVMTLHTMDRQVEREAQRARANREELAERIASAVRQDGVVEPVPGLSVSRRSTPLEPLHAVVKPSLCVVAQGSKELLLGESRYQYDPAHYLLATVELPWITHVLQASREQPYLSLRLELDPVLVGSVIEDAGLSVLAGPATERAIAISPLDANLLDAVVRLARLMERPDEAPALMPLITREIAYRLLLGEQGDRLRRLAISARFASPITRAVARLHHDFDQPLRVEQLAHALGMSVSGFHHQFKAVTAYSPLQFQKRLRLQEARRLMLSEGYDAASAAFRVGYRDAAHFNREYKSLFGAPPMRDVQRLRGSALQSSR
ncbi:MAG TPA: AraC family transcriptional regulator [Ktedonobacterales bacterium]|nr:AraC family transcriptional regulator [Ktedonobacterales bacterium]